MPNWMLPEHIPASQRKRIVKPYLAPLRSATVQVFEDSRELPKEQREARHFIVETVLQPPSGPIQTCSKPPRCSRHAWSLQQSKTATTSNVLRADYRRQGS